MPESLPMNVERILFSEEQLRQIVARLARRIDEDYQSLGEEIVLICILKSALHFFSDLSRRVRTPHLLDLIQARSYYGSTHSSGTVAITKAPDLDLAGRRIILVEDIYDTGRTLARVLEYIAGQGAKSVDVCVLFSKPDAHLAPVDIKYLGAEIPNHFIVGYGLDYDERYRHLPYIGILSGAAGIGLDRGKARSESSGT